MTHATASPPSPQTARRTWAPLSLLDATDPARLVPRWVARRGVFIAGALSVALLAGLLVWAVDQARQPGYRFDWMLVTGYVTAVIGLWLARGQAARFDDAARRLADRRALLTRDEHGEAHETTDAELKGLLDELARRAQLAGHRWGLPAALGTAVVFYVVYDRTVSPDDMTLMATALATATAYLVGRALGRLATYGFLRSPLLADGRTVRAYPGHIDGAAGLKPLGDFYLSQALLLLVPGAFLLAWAVLLRDPYWSVFYGQWEGIYQVLLGIVIVLQIMIFVSPMVTTHRAMKHQKRTDLRQADGLGEQIQELRRELARKLTTDERTATRDQLQAVTDRYREVDSMPTWPVPRKIWRGFALQSVALAAPIVTDFAKSLFGL